MTTKGVRRKRHGRVARVGGNPFVARVNAELVEWLLKRPVLIRNGKGQRNTPSVNRGTDIPRQKVTVWIPSVLNAVRGVKNLVERQASVDFDWI